MLKCSGAVSTPELNVIMVFPVSFCIKMTVDPHIPPSHTDLWHMQLAKLLSCQSPTFLVPCHDVLCSRKRLFSLDWAAIEAVSRLLVARRMDAVTHARLSTPKLNVVEVNSPRHRSTRRHPYRYPFALTWCRQLYFSSADGRANAIEPPPCPTRVC